MHKKDGNYFTLNRSDLHKEKKMDTLFLIKIPLAALVGIIAILFSPGLGWSAGYQVVANADFSNRDIQLKEMSITSKNSFYYNSYYGDSWRILSQYGGFSGTFHAPNAGTVKLEVTHLSSSSSSCQGNGYSPVTIKVNNNSLVTNYDPASHHSGSHSMVTDTWAVQAKAGENSFQWKAGSLCTHYWIKSINIYQVTTPPPPAPTLGKVTSAIVSQLLLAPSYSSPFLKATTLANVSINVPFNTDHLSLLSLSDVSTSIEANNIGSALISTDFYSPVYLTDSNDVIFGIGQSIPGQSGLIIDAESTALAIVTSFPISWGSYGLTFNQLTNLVKSHANFSSLVSRVEQLMTSNPKLLISNSPQSKECYQAAWDILSAILTTHSQKTVQVAKGLNLYGDVHIEDAPYGNIKIVNNKWVPFGIDSLNLTSNTIVGGRPWWVKCRDSWGIFMGGEEITYPIGTGNFITCLSKAPAVGLLPLLNPLAGVAYSAMVTMEQVKLSLDGKNLSKATRMRAMAEMKGKIAWNIFLIIRAANFVPGYGDVVSFGAEIISDLANDPEMNLVTFPYAIVTAKGGVTAAETYTEFLTSVDSQAPNSLLHKTAKKLFKDGRKTKLIKAGGKLLKNALMVPDIIDAAGFLLETALSEDEFCFEIDQNDSGVATISPYSFSINEECNSTSVNGNDDPDTRLINMGGSTGTFSLSYDTYSIKDKIVITHDDQTIFDSGCVGADQTVNISFDGKNNHIVVQVYPNCENTSGTGWTYSVSCPD